MDILLQDISTLFHRCVCVRKHMPVDEFLDERGVGVVHEYISWYFCAGGSRSSLSYCCSQPAVPGLVVRHMDPVLEDLSLRNK